jgi:adenine-specific DNA-methyltransferase
LAFDTFKKPIALASTSDVENVVIPSIIYVLVKRFSSKEEKRRISAALYIPERVNAVRIGIENHVNYFYSRYGEMSLDLAKGLAAYLNSTLVDQYFRQFSGHTQVNATDLRNMKYPSLENLVALGKRLGDVFPTQDEIDQLIEEEFALNAKNKGSNVIDPI